MASEITTFLQSTIIAKFVLPFLLVFFILFAILEKTQIFGENKKQLNALVSFVIGLIFVGFAFPKEVVSNMILFLTVAIIVSFVALLLWGFVSGGTEVSAGMKKVAAAGILISVSIAVLWAVGLQLETVDKVFDWLFYSSWSGTVWTNVLFVIAIAGAVAWAIVSGGKGSG